MPRRRFEFRLARLLRIREVTERQAREAWAATQALAREAAERSDERRADLAREREAFALRLRESPRSAARLLIDQVALDGQAAALCQAAEATVLCEARAETAREAWTERERDRHVLDELRERARIRHRTELNAQEQAEMDEIAVQRGYASRLAADQETTSPPRQDPTVLGSSASS